MIRQSQPDYGYIPDDGYIPDEIMPESAAEFDAMAGKYDAIIPILQYVEEFSPKSSI